MYLRYVMFCIDILVELQEMLTTDGMASRANVGDICFGAYAMDLV